MHVGFHFYLLSTREKQENKLWGNQFREADLPSEHHGVHHKEVWGRVMPLDTIRQQHIQQVYLYFTIFYMRHNSNECCYELSFL